MNLNKFTLNVALVIFSLTKIKLYLIKQFLTKNKGYRELKINHGYHQCARDITLMLGE